MCQRVCVNTMSVKACVRVCEHMCVSTCVSVRVRAGGKEERLFHLAQCAANHMLYLDKKVLLICF